MNKKLLLLFFIGSLTAFSFSGKAQVTLNTFYVIPPTSGCNGVWAIDKSPIDSFMCGPFISYSIDSCWDSQSIGFSGDTMFLALCSLPCSFSAVTAGGCPAYCNTLPTNSIDVNANNVLTLFPNPVTSELTIENGELKIEGVEIYDVMGRMVLPLNPLKGTSASIDVSALAQGIYFVRVRTEKGSVVKKLIIAK